MAKKRMFSLLVTDTDTFLDMPTSAQCLYFHLGMNGDDDGFVGSPKKVIRAVGCSEADLKTLVDNGFIIPFKSGVIVIRDWRLNNTLQNDRYRETVYQQEKAELHLDRSGRYIRNGNGMESGCFQNGNILETEHSLTKPNGTQRNQAKERDNPAIALPSLEEIKGFAHEMGYAENEFSPETFFNFYSSNGWTIQGVPMKDWKASVTTWVLRYREKNPDKAPRSYDAPDDESIFW